MEDFQICQLFFCQFSKNFLYEKPIKIIIITEIADIHFFVNFCQFDMHFLSTLSIDKKMYVNFLILAIIIYVKRIICL